MNFIPIRYIWNFTTYYLNIKYNTEYFLQSVGSSLIKNTNYNNFNLIDDDIYIILFLGRGLSP